MRSSDLVKLQFPVSEGPLLFGNKDELIAEWRKRLGLPVNVPIVTADPAGAAPIQVAD